MSDWQDILTTKVTTDAPLAAILTGGVFAAETLPTNGKDGMTLENAPKQADGIRILPFAVLRLTGGVGIPIRFLKTEDQTFALFAYAEDWGTVRDAIRQVKTLLHEKYLPTTVGDTVGLIYCECVGDLPEFYADELGGRPCAATRFRATIARQ